MGEPDSATGASRSELDTLIEDQSLAVLAALDDLRQDADGSLHDTRVSIRRLRSSLLVFAPLLREDDDVRALAADLRWLTQELGHARDAQVVRARITAAYDDFDATGPQIQALAAAIGDLPGGGRARAALADPRLADLRAHLDLVLLRGAARPAALDGTQVRAHVQATLAATLARAQDAVPEQRRKRDRALHALRKRVKAARSLLGAVRIAPRGSGLGQVARSLERLQDLLGEHQDAIVTEQVLRGLRPGTAEARALASAMAEAERRRAAVLREELPRAVRRLGDAVDRLERRRSAPASTSTGHDT